MNFAIFLGLLASACGLVFAVFVGLTAGKSRSGKVLCVLLVAEALFVGGFTLSDLAAEGVSQESLVGLGFGAALLLSAVYPWVLAELKVPLTAWFRRPMFLRIWSTLYGGYAIVFLTLFWSQTFRGRSVPEDSPLGFAIVPAFLTILLLSTLALVAAAYAFYHAPPGPTREKARAFFLAFGVRDLLFICAIAANFASDLLAEERRQLLQFFSFSLATLGFLLYMPILGYGILRTQLFDIDLKIKIGIRRGTVAGIFLVVVFVAAKVVETYLSRTVGFVAGSAVAGLLLFIVPRLNKLGEKVANTALPTVQPTQAYVQFKKLEVYRAAVESAQETGGIEERERASLRRLQAKLGISPMDAQALEEEVKSTFNPGSS